MRIITVISDPGPAIAAALRCAPSRCRPNNICAQVNNQLIDEVSWAGSWVEPRSCWLCVQFALILDRNYDGSRLEDKKPNCSVYSPHGSVFCDICNIFQQATRTIVTLRYREPMEQKWYFYLQDPCHVTSLLEDASSVQISQISLDSCDDKLSIHFNNLNSCIIT